MLTGIIASYKKVREITGLVWGDGARLVAWRRSVSKRARRRRLFADHLESAMRRLAEQEEWRDTRFAELEAEVELERESAFGWLRRRLGRARSTRIHRVPSLTDALKKSHDRLIVLEGDPGAGKSVALRHVAQGMALRASRRGREGTVLPIYVNLKTFRPPADRPASADDVHAFVLEYLNPAQSRDIDRFLADEFDSGREAGLWLFLFDSFDEIPAILGAAEAGPIIDLYADAIAGFIGIGGSRGIIASREFRGPSRLGWPRFRVMPLTRKRRAELIRRADLDDHAENLLSEVDLLESSVQELADNPLFLSLVCEYVRDHETMPESAHAVLESYVMSRLTRDRERVESRFAITVESARAFAEEMAFQMLASPELGLSVSRETLIEHVAPRLDLEPDEAAAAIDALIYSKLAKVSDADGAVTFSHRRLHEYFATCIVIRDRTRLTACELLTNGRWRETAVAVLQTQRPEDSAELLAEAERLLRAAATTEPGTRPWRPGVLHLLDVLANGLKPELLATHPISELTRENLEYAWENGDRLDKKWVIELCTAAGTEHAIDYLTRAFDSESLWLRNHAYAQVRRIGTAASRLEPQIRQMLVDMSVGGTLRRERRTVRAQLMRTTNPAPLLRTIQVFLVAPAVATIAAGLYGALFLIPATANMLPGVSGWGFAVAVPVLIVVSIFLARFALVSDGRAQRHARRYLVRLGLGEGAENKRLAAAIAFPTTMLFAFMSPVQAWARAPEGRSVLGPILISIAGLLVGWSHIMLALTASGLPLWRPRWIPPRIHSIRTLISKVGPNLRRFLIAVSIPAALMALILILVSIIPLIMKKVLEWISILALVPVSIAIAGGVGKVLGRAWQQRRDRGTVSALRRQDGETSSVGELQDTLNALKTDQGVRTLLHDLQRKGLQRTNEVAGFLAFLGRRLERPYEKTDDGWPTEWNEWWQGYRAGPLRNPSSETLDEIGRILEDAQRSVRFGG